MNAPVDAKQAYLAAAAALRDRAPGHAQAWVRALRERAYECFAQSGFPTTREEAWRYTNLAALSRQAFAPAAHDAGPVAQEILGTAAFAELNAYRLVFVGSRYRPELSDPPPADAGVFAASLSDALTRSPEELQGLLGEIGAPEAGAFAALSSALLVDGAYVRVVANMPVARPIHLIHVGAPNALSSPRTLVVADENSEATIIEHYVGLDAERYFSNALTEISLAPGARMTHYRVQEESAQGFHIGGVHVRQERDSAFASRVVDLGGLLVRNDLHTALSEGASCTFDGLYVLGGRQHVDNHTVIEHAAPHTTSRELYKGVLDGRARAVFNGRVVVHPDAQKSDAQQTNNNLLLSEDAEIDTKPELEIYADDVKCSHGATVGQLDPDQLYYLRTRAVDEASARDLLTFAFANDVLRRFELAPLRAALDRSLMNRLLQGRAIREVELV
jgi:Fe-S cluster assembly protein SufD